MPMPTFREFFSARGPAIVVNPVLSLIDHALDEKAASKATEEAAKSFSRMVARDSGAPHSRSMPLSSHSMDRGPL
jgi:hypothetical protein